MKNGEWKLNVDFIPSDEELMKPWIEQISYSFDASGNFTEDATYYGSPNIWSESRKG